MILVGARPREAAFSSDGKFAYVTSEIASEVARVDMTSLSIAQKANFEAENVKPKGIVLLEERGELYVTTGRANSIEVLDAETLEARASIGVGRRVWGLVAGPAGRMLYSADGLDNAVSVVDIEARERLLQIPVGERPWGLVVLEP